MQLDVGYEISVPVRGIVGGDLPSAFVPLAVRGWVLLITGDNPAVAQMLGFLKKSSSAWAPCRNCCAHRHLGLGYRACVRLLPSQASPPQPQLPRLRTLVPPPQTRLSVTSSRSMHAIKC